LGIGTNGQVLTSTGTAPQWSTLSGVAVTTFSAGTTGFTPSTATSGAVTLAGTLATTNGGTGLTSFTANGVLYASSTSALATGSVLKFDGTNLSLGQDPAARFSVSRGSNGPIASFTNGLDADFYINGTSGVTLITPTTAVLAFGVSNSEQMRLTSTGLGIGTSSPGYRLDTLFGAGSGNIFRAGQSGVSNGYTITTSGSALTHIWANGGSDAMRLDSSGNLGLGVTPSASTVRAFQVPASTVIGAQGEGLNITANAYFDSSWKRHVTGTATWYQQASGQHAWWNAGSSTAGSTISFTQAMTLDASGNLGIGTSSPGYKLSVNGASSGVVANIGFNGDSGTGLYVGVNHSSNLVQLYASGSANKSLAFYTGSTETMRLDSSGNLGLGASPSSYFSTGRFILTYATSGKAANEIIVADGVDNHRVALFVNDTTGKVGLDTGSTSASYSGLSFFIEGTERAVLDRSGNLGLGVTPGTWSDGKVIEINTAGNALWGEGNFTVLVQNARYNSGYVYARTGVASSHYDLEGGSHKWYTAPSGTAGNAISFTQAMTLDASGNLLVGTTTSAYSAAGRGLIELNGSSDSLFALKRNNTNNFYIQNASDAVYFQNTANTAIIFGTNDTERARITSGGDLLVGTTSATSRSGITAKTVSSAVSSQDAISAQTNSNSYFTVCSHVSTTSGTRYHIGFGDGTTWTERGTISTDGTSTSYNTSSDYRLKNITGPVTNSGAYIDALKPVEGTWKADGSTFVGLIAHEVQEVSRTNIATGTKDGERMQGMDYSASEIIANLIAEVQSLRARVAQLENLKGN
jgi:hypothetical protein